MPNKLSLSKIARDPELAAFFRRGERDAGPEPVVARPPRPRLLTDGAAEQMKEMADA
ncbi:hypothetical protein [Mesorhizobium sp. B2-4-14]|uniref:hypothetical protein n=1 Tax=Mesorhizobium sp. B2-4-14 TaxID=2589935 RepID=UPI0015E447DC|nr:hypothetical protein [Mesorhizobium sp. B2-4-14]